MKALYVESSAVLAWLLGEPTAGWVAYQIDKADVVYASALTIVETARGLLVARQDHRITPEDFDHLNVLLHDVASQWFILEMSATVLERAERPFPAERVRTLDALHLAAAESLLDGSRAVHLLTLDKRIAQNAKELGLELCVDRRLADRRQTEEPVSFNRRTHEQRANWPQASLH